MKRCCDCYFLPGWQPQGEQIDAGLPLDAPLHCGLPLQAIAEELVEAGFPVQMSSDPGECWLELMIGVWHG